MGKTRRRKAAIGFGTKPQSAVCIEIGDFAESREPGIQRIAKQAKSHGVIDQGLAVPFIVKLNSEGCYFGLGFPGIKEDMEIFVGLVVVKIEAMTQESAIIKHRALEKEITKLIALKFKLMIESEGKAFIAT